MGHGVNRDVGRELCDQRRLDLISDCDYGLEVHAILCDFDQDLQKFSICKDCIAPCLVNTVEGTLLTQGRVDRHGDQTLSPNRHSAQHPFHLRFRVDDYVLPRLKELL